MGHTSSYFFFDSARSTEYFEGELWAPLDKTTTDFEKHSHADSTRQHLPTTHPSTSGYPTKHNRVDFAAAGRETIRS